MGKKLSPEDAIEAIDKALGALSHCSYCEIFGTRPNRTVLGEGWDALRDLKKGLKPDEDFRDEKDPEKERPYLEIKRIEDHGQRVKFSQKPDEEKEEILEKLFVSTFNVVASLVHETAREKGWLDKDRSDGELIALEHSKLSEGLEALRHGNPPDDKIQDFSGVEAEMADVVIRIMDNAQARSWDVAGAIVAKMKMNKKREKMHGGKKF